MDDTKIREVIKGYFDAGYVDDGDAMGEAFHDAAHLYSRNEDGTLNDCPRQDFVDRLNSRDTDPDDPGYPRYDEILSIEFTGENTAVALVKVRVRDTVYTDILSFLRLGDRWAIIAKVFTGVPA